MLVKYLQDLCYDCHTSEELKRARKHGPVAIGMCDGCHTSHQSEFTNLLIREVPRLCFRCHTEKGFVFENVHPPVAEGKCFECHGKHTSKFSHLMEGRPGDLCRKCHEDVFDDVHPLTGFSQPAKEKDDSLASVLFGEAGPQRKGHPLRGKDPKRPRRGFGCMSCHVPHSSPWQDLFRYEATEPKELCVHCHEKRKR
jgi:predicted CXXCH cytochrome family protein